MTHTIHTHATPDDTARAVANLIYNSAIASSKLSKYLNVALSGGSTPKLLFAILASEYKDKMPWSTLRLFWVDERCVAPTHPESNFGMTYDSLLKEVPIPESNIFRMKGEDVPVVEAKRYQALLSQELTMHNAYPQFDIILLGMGDDGHTASIFPNQMSLLTDANAVCVAVHPTSGQERITLTGNCIGQASQLIFLVTGSNKASLLAQIVSKDPVSLLYPASQVFSVEGDADFFLDDAAASNL